MYKVKHWPKMFPCILETYVQPICYYFVWEMPSLNDERGYASSLLGYFDLNRSIYNKWRSFLMDRGAALNHVPDVFAHAWSAYISVRIQDENRRERNRKCKVSKK
jgi:hypothetical protein